MNTEDKQKAMLADDLSAYIKDKHTQEECIGFIDGYNAALTKLKLLGIGVVSQQRELLNFLKWYDEDLEYNSKQTHEQLILSYGQKFNCG
jgi:hypothetical protein